MDIGLFMEILAIDSTSSKERTLADFLEHRLPTSLCEVSRYEVGDGTVNLLFSWGTPKILFCTHMDTVPPYLPPVREELPDGDTIFRGRGTCDAKGQLFSMYEACLELERQGKSDFGLLLLAGEETGSYGAKSFREVHPGAEYVVVGEPTDNKMVSASKGTKSFGLKFTGRPFHSGYPEYGVSAVGLFVDFTNALRSIVFPEDPVLGETTWNIGKLSSDNPQNILSPELTCRLYFRTTAASDAVVCNVMKNIAGEDAKLHFGGEGEWQKRMSVVAYGGDTPMEYMTVEGIPETTVAFGSDAPQLSNCRNRMLCGPGSILVAHTSEENIKLSEMETAVRNYVRIYDRVMAKIS